MQTKLCRNGGARARLRIKCRSSLVWNVCPCGGKSLQAVCSLPYQIFRACLFGPEMPAGRPIGGLPVRGVFLRGRPRCLWQRGFFLRHEQVCTCRRLGAFHGPQAHGGGGATASAAGMADECPAAQRIEAMEPRDKRRKFFSAGIGHSPRIGLLFQRLVQPQKALMAAIGGNEAASGHFSGSMPWPVENGEEAACRFAWRQKTALIIEIVFQNLLNTKTALENLLAVLAASLTRASHIRVCPLARLISRSKDFRFFSCSTSLNM